MTLAARLARLQHAAKEAVAAVLRNAMVQNWKVIPVIEDQVSMIVSLAASSGLFGITGLK